MSMLIQMPTEQHFVVLLPLCLPSIVPELRLISMQMNVNVVEKAMIDGALSKSLGINSVRLTKGILVALCLIVTKKKGKTSVFGLIAMKRFTYSNCTEKET
ncbi:uncharacterized protein LOC141623933 isoform X4 [Silene latifolia]|uniref:uncharacterized protein LOC141623933 isoform X4 n=1 Tax=Silene latifolia TaxID=37657 RepID=UPI003D784212